MSKSNSYSALINESPNRDENSVRSCLRWSNLCAQFNNTKSTSFKDMFTKSTAPPDPINILENVSGTAESGRLLAILGQSGSGKTTLLHLLSGREIKNIKCTGSITVEGEQVTRERMREISGFVQQHDQFFSYLTVREHLSFTAKLKMGSDHTKWERNTRVDDVMRQMGLLECADTKIGNSSMKGLSNGEKKRLALASELLKCPKILFCDEPTSGLDSFMAAHVVSSLRELTFRGVTVILTIHQPQSHIYNLFDSVYLLEGGRTIFQGNQTEAEHIFEKCNYPCPEYYNFSDHMIRTLGTKKEAGDKIRKFYERGIGHKQTSGYEDAPFRKSSAVRFLSQSHSSPFFVQFFALLWRCWVTVARDPTVFKVRIVQVLIISLITGLSYFNTIVAPSTILTINGIMFNSVRYCNQWQFPNVPAIADELPMVFRESEDGLYRLSAYFLAKNFAELPQYIFLPFFYNVIVYWVSGLYRDVFAFLFATLVMVLVANAGNSIAYAVATSFEDTAKGMSILPLFVIPMFAFGGFFIAVESIPDYFQWMSALSYFKYGFQAMAVNEWENIPSIPGCSSFNSGCPTSGSAVLEQMTIGDHDKWTDIYCLLAIILGFRLISYIALMIRGYRRKT